MSVDLTLTAEGSGVDLTLATSKGDTGPAGPIGPSGLQGPAGSGADPTINYSWTGNHTWSQPTTFSGVVYAESGVIRNVLDTNDPTVNVTNENHIIICDPSSNAMTINLPTAVGQMGREFVVKSIDDTNNVTIDPNGSETIDGDTTKIIQTAYASVSIVSNGTNWFIF